MIIDETPTSFRFKASLQIQKAFEAAGIYFSLVPKTYRLRDGEIIKAVKGPKIEPFVIYNANTMFPLGFASYTNANIDPEVTVGRYTSIASGGRMMGLSHPLDRVTTNTITYGQFSNIHLNPVEALGGGKIKTKPFQQKPPAIVRDDVWIGQDVLLARGIILDTGCVVAAGSVVTKSVPPYAIVGGNPAKIIKYRFDERLIERLLASRWWEYAFPHLHELPSDQPEAFLDEFSELVAEGTIQPYSPLKVDPLEIVRSAI
jgi:acetyltransferase-like isoleucine patch superfamily enzyme